MSSGAIGPKQPGGNVGFRAEGFLGSFKDSYKGCLGF